MASSMKVAAALLPAVAASSIYCRNSPANPHAQVQLTATVKSTPCKSVYEEITARASGEDGWVDPHNGGTYKITKQGENLFVWTDRTANTKAAVGGKAYVDQQAFHLTQEGPDCKIDACSDSQSVSVFDFSTNYCDLHNLYCGPADGCSPVLHAWSVSERVVQTSFGAGKDKSKCIVKSSDAVASSFLTQSSGSMTCPGSAALGLHASAQVVATAQASCADVAAEITARAKGEQDWVDPHNHGVYSLLSSDTTQIQTQRTTNPKTSVGHKVYADKQTFTLTPANDACVIEACSESQSFSFLDYSTNYCDMRNLYCGKDDGCKTVLHDFKVTESVKTSAGAGKDKSQCIVVADEIEV